MQKIFTAFACWAATSFFHHQFLLRHEKKMDLMVLSDPIIHRLPTYDVSIIITITTFTKIALLIWNITITRITFVMWSCIFMFLLRTICMFLTPLKVHPQNIPIRDIILDRFLQHESFRNDLLFSGHLGHCLIIAYITPEYQNFLLFLALVICLSMLISKTHYTIDLFITPFMIYPCLRMAHIVCD